MITIHLARSASEEIPKDNLVLGEINQYPAIREQIFLALKQEQDIDILVLNRVCDEWFWDLSDYFQDVLLINDSPVERLKRKLLIDSLPIELTTKPDLILELQLLDLPKPREDETDIWTWIIRHKLGEVWTVEEPSNDHFSLLVNWYIDNRVGLSLQEKVDDIVKSWIRKASGNLISTYSRFFEDPSKNAYLLTAARALLTYDDDLRKQWLIAAGWYSSKLEDIIDLVKPLNNIPVLIRKKFNPTILTYWNTRFKELFND